MKYLVEKIQGQADAPYKNDANECFSSMFCSLDDALAEFEAVQVSSKEGVFLSCTVEAVIEYGGDIVYRECYIEKGFDDGKPFRHSRLVNYR